VPGITAKDTGLMGIDDLTQESWEKKFVELRYKATAAA
jgi:hypothetical protein